MHRDVAAFVHAQIAESLEDEEEGCQPGRDPGENDHHAKELCADEAASATADKARIKLSVSAPHTNIVSRAKKLCTNEESSATADKARIKVPVSAPHTNTLTVLPAFTSNSCTADQHRRQPPGHRGAAVL